MRTTIGSVKLGGADPHTVASYVNEISLLQKLRGHDHIVTLFDAHVDRTHGYIYMVSDLAVAIKAAVGSRC